ncbi:putative proteasome subunit alpha type-4 [Nosema granulosis]|uniref:Proteasome subunit alpha type-4 n=1 Tax=Nosema granulosis TaxID=83296 RepID=A0A9P6H0P9_9MICR|nr:putative proteasome subunit alpha type-4 [Nosema granulosis]
MEYENNLGIFSPDGRLIQVEYAQQASEQGSLVVFSSVPGKICVSVEVKTQNKMLIDSMKLLKVDTDQNIWMSYSGLRPDADKVLNSARIICRNHKILTGEDISIDALAYKLSKFKQKYTLGEGMRPLGIRTVLFYVGDSTKVIVVEPDGNYSEWISGAVGQKSSKVCEFIQENLSEDVVNLSVSGLGTVVQSDKNKIISYLIQKDGVEMVDSSTINDLIKNISV